MKVKAIETVHNGYRFRSRLEARWAVFFDALAIAYEYEREGFDLGDTGCYLPEFWLPQQGIWIEIKPAEYDNKGEIIWPETPKQNALTDISGQRVVTLCGSPGMPRDPLNPTPWQSYMGFISGDWMYFWCQCSSCRGIGIEFEGRSERIKHFSSCPINSRSGKYRNTASVSLQAAYLKAKQARFEHGERP